jgi:hypothetical protein
MIPRLTISKLTVVVAVVAVNLAAGRALLADEAMLYGVGLSGLTLQLASFRLLRCRGRSRAFWRGFVLAGAATLMSFTWGLAQSAQRSGTLRHRVRYGDLTWTEKVIGFWANCGEGAAQYFQPAPFSISRIGYGPLLGCWYWDPRHRAWVVTAGACGSFVTQMSMALGGGLLARGFAGMRRRLRSSE